MKKEELLHIICPECNLIFTPLVHNEEIERLIEENKRLKDALRELADEPIDVDPDAMPDEYMTRKMMIEAAKLALGDYHATQERLQSKDCQ